MEQSLAYSRNSRRDCDRGIDDEEEEKEEDEEDNKFEVLDNHNFLLKQEVMTVPNWWLIFSL